MGILLGLVGPGTLKIEDFNCFWPTSPNEIAQHATMKKVQFRCGGGKKKKKDGGCGGFLHLHHLPCGASWWWCLRGGWWQDKQREGAAGEEQQGSGDYKLRGASSRKRI